MQVICQFCKKNVEQKDAVRYNNKNYHFNCKMLQEQKDALCKYICELFNLKRPGPIVYSQIKKFIDEYGYTYTGIHKSLQYFYEIKNNSKINSNNAIGIVPYIYNDAKEYYRNIQNKKEKILKSAQNQKEKKDIVIFVEKKEKSIKKEKLDLNNI